jgi:hypothetical protein
MIKRELDKPETRRGCRRVLLPLDPGQDHSFGGERSPSGVIWAPDPGSKLALARTPQDTGVRAAYVASGGVRETFRVTRRRGS